MRARKKNRPLGQTVMKNHSVMIGGRNSSISLEDAFWESFCAIAKERKITHSALASEINNAGGTGNLSSRIRLAVLAHYQKRATVVEGSFNALVLLRYIELPSLQAAQMTRAVVSPP